MVTSGSTMPFNSLIVKIASSLFPKFRVFMLLQYLQGAEVFNGREE